MRGSVRERVGEEGWRERERREGDKEIEGGERGRERVKN